MELTLQVVVAKTRLVCHDFRKFFGLYSSFKL